MKRINFFRTDTRVATSRLKDDQCEAKNPFSVPISVVYLLTYLISTAKANVRGKLPVLTVRNFAFSVICLIRFHFHSNNKGKSRVCHQNLSRPCRPGATLVHLVHVHPPFCHLPRIKIREKFFSAAEWCPVRLENMNALRNSPKGNNFCAILRRVSSYFRYIDII